MNNTACGPKHADTDPIAALPQAFFDGYPGATANPNDSPLCGKDIIISASATPGGPLLTARATVSDICGDCNITTSVDVTPVVFTQFTDQLAGRLHNISWDFASAANATSESVGLASMDVSTSARPTTMAPVGRSSRSRRGRH
ncbi:hypothetical protein B0H10DRAFT_1823119 [Mycena sp. CBHHK59/15]|nr:hypothetical protein B0H10DRAFT_1823119 [Mycena sp. CBHHK59/15]